MTCHTSPTPSRRVPSRVFAIVDDPGLSAHWLEMLLVTVVFAINPVTEGTTDLNRTIAVHDEFMPRLTTNRRPAMRRPPSL